MSDDSDKAFNKILDALDRVIEVEKIENQLFL